MWSVRRTVTLQVTLKEGEEVELDVGERRPLGGSDKIRSTPWRRKSEERGL